MALQKLYPKEMMPDFASSKTCKKKLCFYKENQSYLCPANIRSRFSVSSIIVYNHLSINFGFLELGLQSVKDGFPPAMNIICCWLVSQLCPTVFRPMDCTARQAPLLDFSGKNTSGLPFPPQVDLPNSRIQPTSPALQEEVKIMGVLMSAKLRKT